MTASDILSDLTAIFRDCFEDESMVLLPSMLVRDLPGCDSARIVLLIFAVEERFGIRMRSREIDALRCVGDWLNLIEARRNSP
jgi:acyl carrier protein